jgi:hypothetical protein
MKKLALIFVVLASAVAASPASGQLLPSQFGGWTRVSCFAKPQALAVAPEAGLLDLESCTYTSGNNKIGIWIHKLHDPSAAYEVYTSGLHPGMMPSLVGTNAAVDQERLWMLTGNLVLQISSQNLATESDLRALVKSLDGHADRTPLPEIRSYLPENGLIQGTQRYALGPDGYAFAVKSLGRPEFATLAPELSIGPKSAADAEVMLGAYNNGKGGQEVLLLALYPTPQLAEQQLHHLKPILESKPELAGTTVERDASMLSLVLSPSSPEMASRLRKGINYETAITWNEPSTTLTDPTWFQVLKTVFFAAAAICVFAAIGGLIYGVFRLVMKRLFPGKVFDRSTNVELLQLGLNSKEINPDDFY